MSSQAATANLADFIVNSGSRSMPSDVMDVGSALLLDSVGCALAGHGVTKGRTAVASASDFGEGAEVTIIGAGRGSILGATFANGELINAIDMDSVVMETHVTPYVLPACLAAAELSGASGADLVRAVAMAHEVAIRTCGAFTHLRDEGSNGLADATGYGPTIVGATAGAALLFGLNERQLLDALGIAAYMAPVPALGKYLRSSRGADSKYGSAGWVSAGAVLAARLALRGYSGDREVLDGDHGFWRMCASGACDWDFMLGELGNVWHIKRAEIKPYASSRGSHRHIEVFSRILQERSIDLSDIDEVVVVADVVSRSPIFLNTDVRDSDAFMSWAYVLGAAALYPTGADWYSKRALEDQRIKEFLPKVVVQEHPVKNDERASSRGADSRHASVVVRTGTNSFSVELPDFARGHPSRPLSAGEVDEKFLRNASEQMRPEVATRVLAQLRTILEADDLGDLYACLGGVPT